MAPVAPIIEQDVELRPVGTSGMLQKQSNAYIKRDTSPLFNAATQIAEEAKKRGDEMRMVEAQKKLDDWKHINIYSPETGGLARKGKDAFNLPNELGTRYDKEMDEYEKTLSSQEQRDMFAKMRVNERGSIVNTLDGHARKEMDGYADTETKSATASAIGVAIETVDNPIEFNAALSRAKAPILIRAKRNGLSETDESVMRELALAESEAYLGALNRMADQNPGKAINFYKQNIGKFKEGDLLKASALMTPTERKYKSQTTATKVMRELAPPRTMSEIIDNTIDLEGGDQTVVDVNGAVARAGINLEFQTVDDPVTKTSRKMTREELDAMTPEEIRSYYKKNYWDKGGIGDLPPQMQAVAFDAVVQHGADDDTLSAIKAADGDPAKLLQWRLDKINALYEKNPAKWGSRIQGMRNRLTRLAAQLDTDRGALPSETDLYNRIDETTDDIEVATDAKQLVKTQIAAMKAAREEAWNMADEEAAAQLEAGQDVSPSTLAKMKPSRIAELRKAAPNPELYEELRDKVSRGADLGLNEDGTPRTLAQHRWQLGNKYGELLEMQNTPEKRLNARKIDDVMAEGYGILLGGAKPKTEKDFAIVKEFRRRMEEEQAAITKTRAPTAEDMEKVSLKLLAEVEAKGVDDFMGSSKKLFEVREDEAIEELDGLDPGNKYVIGDKVVPYEHVARRIIDDLSAMGLPASPENVRDYYKRLKKNNFIAEKN